MLKADIKKLILTAIFSLALAGTAYAAVDLTLNLSVNNPGKAATDVLAKFTFPKCVTPVNLKTGWLWNAGTRVLSVSLGTLVKGESKAVPVDVTTDSETCFKISDFKAQWFSQENTPKPAPQAPSPVPTAKNPSPAAKPVAVKPAAPAQAGVSVFAPIKAFFSRIANAPAPKGSALSWVIFSFIGAVFILVAAGFNLASLISGLRKSRGFYQLDKAFNFLGTYLLVVIQAAVFWSFISWPGVLGLISLVLILAGSVLRIWLMSGTLNIEGAVFAKESRSGLPQAIVRVFKGDMRRWCGTILTDAAGQFNFRVLAGQYSFQLDADGYKELLSKPMEARNKQNYQSFELEKAGRLPVPPANLPTAPSV